MADNHRTTDPKDDSESSQHAPVPRPAMFLVTGPLDKLRLRLAAGFYERADVQREVAERLLKDLSSADDETR